MSKSLTNNFEIKNILNGNLSDVSRSKKTDIKILDSDWIQSRFMVSNDDLPPEIRKHRFRSTATIKFTDSSLGGNIIINPRPQFTRYCDIRNKGRVSSRGQVTRHKITSGLTNQGVGMGRYYSEAIDDNQQAVFMEFGMPKFNSMKDFFMRAVDYGDSVLANTGRPATMYRIGQGIGGAVMLAAFPLITMTIYAVKSIASLFATEGDFKYYYLEPNMQLYWATVNTIVSQIATELGILAPMFMENASPSDVARHKKNAGSAAEKKIPNRVNIGKEQVLTQADIDEFKTLMPGIIGDNNYIDVFAIVTRVQALANAQSILEYEDIEALSDHSPELNIKKANNIWDTINYHMMSLDSYNKEINTVRKGEPKGDEIGVDVDKKLADKNAELKKSKPELLADKKMLEKETTKDTAGNLSKPKPTAKEKSTLDRFLNTVDSSIRQGGAYAVFGVDFTGSVSESFSNSTGEISLANKAKAMSKKARDLKFNLAGGNAVTEMGDIMGGVKDLAAGMLDSISFGLSNVISTMTGGAFVEVPKKWEDSSVSLPSVTYNMQLVSPYGNALSQMQNIYIPLSMLLAGTLPLATGKSSYTSPYLCSIYSRGVQNVKLGVISSLSITRGTSNLIFDKNRRILAIDVSFTVSDFSTKLAAPVNGSGLNIEGLFSFSTEDDTTFGNYISVLASRDILMNKYGAKRFKLKLSRKLMGMEQTFSSAAMGMRVGNSLSNVLGALVSTRTLTDNYY